MNPPSPPNRVLVIGGGEFGLSSALALLNSTYQNHPNLITILDRSASPPSTDAASYDYNKIVRSDYSDPLYSQLGKLAIQKWSTPPWSPHFHNSGIIILSSTTSSQSTYVQESLLQNPSATLLATPEAIGERLGGGMERGGFEGDVAYFNPVGGWAAATHSMKALAGRLRDAGVQFITGQASNLIYSEKKSLGNEERVCRGARLGDGRVVEADFVIVAAGAWSCALLPELKKELVASGQFVATLQLSEEEGKLYRDTPVFLALDTGFYCFPPNEDNIVKVAIHGGGYLSEDGLPRTILSKGAATDQIPLECIQILRTGLARVYPALAKKSFSSTRLCWYTESPTSNFLLDYLSPSLFAATAGSGHGFKFAPILSDLIEGVLNRTIEEEFRALWSLENVNIDSGGDKSRGGTENIQRKKLNLAEMATKEDLLVPLVV